MAVGDVYALTLNATYAGQRIQNTLYFRTKDPADPGDAQVQALASDIKDDWREMQVNTLTYNNWIIQQVRGGTVDYISKRCQRLGGFRFEGLFSGSAAGVQIPDGLPPQSAWVTTLYTGQAGRRKRGRCYLSGIPELWNSAGTISAAGMTEAVTRWGSIFAAYKVGGTSLLWEWGVWSQTTASGCTARTEPPWGLAPTETPNPAGAFTPITVVTPRATVYTQRKRTIGKGI